MMTMDITPTRAADIGPLQRVLDTTDLFPSAMLPDMLAPALEGSTDAFWLSCRLENVAVGFCYAAQEHLTNGTWNLLALAVHPQHQGKRLGVGLLKAVEHRLKTDGQRLLIVDTSGDDSFARIRKFYALNGYEEEARIRDYWAKGDDKVTFRKPICQRV